MRRRLERWRLVVTVVVLCAATSSRGVRCESEQLCSAIEDARLCLASERTGARCKWCSPKERSQKGYCIDISAPSEICTDGDIFEFDDSLFRSAGVETHFEKSSLFITPTEIDDKLFVLGLPVPPALDNALTVEEDEFIPLFACNEYVLGEVTRTLEKILYKKRVSSARDEIHKEFPDVPTTDTESILRSIQKQTMNHLGRIAGSVLPAVGIPIGEAQINMVAPAISAFVHGVRVVTGVAKDFIAPVHGNTIVNLNKGGMVEGGRYFHFSDFWQAYKRLRGVLSRAGPLESILDEALRTIEVERTTSELHAANEHLLNKFAKTAVHSLLGLLSGGISVPLSVSADAAASFVIEEKHNRNVASRSVLMVYILYLRELLCAEHLAQPSSSISTDSDSTTLPQEVQPGTNPPVLPSSEASTQRALRLGDFWAPALKRVKPCDIREPNPCPFGFYCHRDTLFRINNEWNPVGYCSPATFPRRKLGEPCEMHSDCLSGICEPPPKRTEPHRKTAEVPPKRTKLERSICLRASDVDLGGCREIRGLKILTSDDNALSEAEFTEEEVQSVKRRYKDAQKALVARQQAFAAAREKLKKHRLKDESDPHCMERERLEDGLAFFLHRNLRHDVQESHLTTYDPWFQQPREQMNTNVEEVKGEMKPSAPNHHVATGSPARDVNEQGLTPIHVPPTVANTQKEAETAPTPDHRVATTTSVRDKTRSRQRQVPMDFSGISVSTRKEAEPVSAQGSESHDDRVATTTPGRDAPQRASPPTLSKTQREVETAQDPATQQLQGHGAGHVYTNGGKSRRGQKIAPIISWTLIAFQEAHRAYNKLYAAKKAFASAQEEVRKIFYYQCKAEGESAEVPHEADMWKSVRLPTVVSETLKSIFRIYDEELKRCSGVHKLMLINHLLGHILRVGLTKADHIVIHWMLMTCFKPDPNLAKHGLRNKLQIRLAQTIAEVIPCEDIYTKWLRHAGHWLRHMEDPVVNCPSLAFQLLVASERC